MVLLLLLYIVTLMMEEKWSKNSRRMTICRCPHFHTLLLMRKKSSDDIVESIYSTKQSDLLADGDLNKRRIYDLSKLFCAPQVRCA